MVDNMPSSDNSSIVERIKAVEITTENNKELLDKANADIDKLVDHVNSSMKNAKEISNIKKEMSDMKATINIGRGAVRTLVWVGTIITAIIGAVKIGESV